MKIVRPEEFYSETPPPRIIGTESECSIQSGNNYDLQQYILPKSLRRSGIKSANGFLDNGYRLYVDVGHLEIDTPECLGPRQAAAADYAAVLLLGKIVENSTVQYDGLYRHTGTEINGEGCTNGYHENFMIPSSIANSKLLDIIYASHLASRIWSFAGAVTTKFNLSQKIKDISGRPLERHDQSRRLSNKPMAMIPSLDQDTIGNTNDWSRLEVRFADTGFSLTARYLSLAAGSLVLRLIEHKNIVDTENLIKSSFKKPLEAANRFNLALSFKETALTIGGKTISALDYQKLLASEAKLLSEKIELPEDEAKAIDLWISVCDQLSQADLSSGQYEGLLKVLDFPIRHFYLTSRFPEEIINSHNADVVQANIMWDRISPIGGGMTYWSRIKSDYVSDDDVKRALTKPPKTRASIRSSIISTNSIRSLDNTTWSYTDVNGSRVNFGDPYDSY